MPDPRLNAVGWGNPPVYDYYGVGGNPTNFPPHVTPQDPTLALERIIIAMLMDNLGIDHLDIPQCTLEMYRPRFNVQIHIMQQLEEIHVKLLETPLPA